MYYISYVIYEEENPTKIEWCFVIQVNSDAKQVLMDGGKTIEFGIDDITKLWDFIGRYDSDVFYASPDNLHDTFNDACKDILKELF